MNRSRFVVMLLAVGTATLTGCQVDTTPTEVSPESAITASYVSAGAFVDNGAPTSFGRYRGAEYLRYTGRFIGETSQGAFRVPYEIVVPARPGRSNGAVLVEPPHFAQRAAARDDYFGREFLFDRGFSYASVGWSFFGNSILDPSASDAVIAGGEDDEIVVQFIRALREDSYALGILPPIDRVYGYGYSQTSFLMHRILRSAHGQGLLDLTMLNATWWPAAGLGGQFAPVDGVGKVIIVQSEGDLILSDAEQLRRAAAHPGYRLYEVAGAAHIPEVAGLLDNPAPVAGTNPTDWPAVARAAFVAGDGWVGGAPPPASQLLEVDQSGAPDPVYGFPTGISRDEALNAIGGVRLPNVALGTAQFIASDFTAPIPALLGSTVDRVCASDADGSPIFANHGRYVSAFGSVADGLRNQRLLLQSDASEMKRRAAASPIGMPRACTP
jgi:hypothetical protein